MNISNTSTTSIVPLPTHAQHPIAPTTPRSTWIKCKWTNVFDLVIQATKHNKVLIKAMDQINKM
jgi:hypothetical protein